MTDNVKIMFEMKRSLMPLLPQYHGVESFMFHNPSWLDVDSTSLAKRNPKKDNDLPAEICYSESILQVYG